MGDGGGSHSTDWTPGGALHTGYVVQHYRKLDGQDIPSGYWVYLRPVSGGAGYKIHLSGAGHAGQIQAMSGSEHPRELRVATGTEYAAVWSDVELAAEAIDRELGRAESRITPTAEDARRQQLKVPPASEYPVLHLRRTGGTVDIASGSWVYLRSAGSTRGYQAHLDSAGHASHIDSLSGAEHPPALRVAQRSTYEAVWAPSELTGPLLERAFSAAGARVTPAAEDATAQRLVVALADEYVVLHFKQSDGTHDVPQGYVYLRPAAGGTGYEVLLDQSGHVGQITALSGSDQPAEVRVRIGTAYAAFWSTVQVPAVQREEAFGDEGNHITPVEDDGQHQQLKVPAGPIVITSTTFATSPIDRQRRKLAVGEKVTLQAQNLQGTAAVNWTQTGAGHFARTIGPSVDWDAPPQPENPATITVTQGTRTKSIPFEVVAPSETKLLIVSPYHPGPREPHFTDYKEHTHGWCDSGFHARVHLMPDDVNFYAVEFLEIEFRAVGTTGSGADRHDGGIYLFAPADRGHHPAGPLPLIRAGDGPPDVVPGLGTPGNLIDHIYSGWNGHQPVNSEITYPIDQQYSVPGTEFRHFYTCVQSHSADVVNLGEGLLPVVTLHSVKAGVSPADVTPETPDTPSH